VRVPEIYEIYAADWPRFDFTEAGVAQTEESVDDYSLFVNMNNRHLRRLLTTTDYQAAGIARIKSSYLVQADSPGIGDNITVPAVQKEHDQKATVITTAAPSQTVRNGNSGPPHPTLRATLSQAAIMFGRLV
jgi:hypothetical protein